MIDLPDITLPSDWQGGEFQTTDRRVGRRRGRSPSKTYTLEKQTMEQVVVTGKPQIVSFPSHAAAIQFRQRCYIAIRLARIDAQDREEELARENPNLRPGTEDYKAQLYESVTIRVRGDMVILSPYSINPLSEAQLAERTKGHEPGCACGACEGKRIVEAWK